jgi:hypothetical protein
VSNLENPPLGPGVGNAGAVAQRGTPSVTAANRSLSGSGTRSPGVGVDPESTASGA